MLVLSLAELFFLYRRVLDMPESCQGIEDEIKRSCRSIIMVDMLLSHDKLAYMHRREIWISA